MNTSITRHYVFAPCFVLVAALGTLLAGCAGEDSASRASTGQTAGQTSVMAAEETMDESPEDVASAVQAGDAEMRTGGGSVVARAGDAEVTTGGGSAVARAGDVVASSGGAGANAGDANANGASAGDQEDAERAVLRLEGDSGTEFSGVCVVGGDRRQLDGEVPEEFTYDLDGAKLACDIEKRGSGELRIVLAAGEDMVVRETNAENAEISLVYRDGSIVSSQSSSSSSSSQSSGSSIQQSSSSQSISSSSSVTQTR